ncbi:Rho GDP-dissociation inhibitor 2 [Dissostichus eleginoides]|uniref:Rho GDP-dissociation inhibitor 3 n=1 Tax=Dissostichus eleginoides TaxID=100907 RepID=A0AAD9B5Z7_DISEL|nr:Rho GDP-dissociation inhibitor 2 [Dissostichus eleginoides]
MLGLDVCEFGGQVLELLWLTMCYRGILADKKDLYIEEEEDDRNLGYTAPVQKSLEEIQALDKDDESLVKYKQTLLGKATLLADPSVQNVQVTRLTLLCDEAPRPLTMDLTEVSDQKDKKTISIKEGVTFRLKIDFKVNGEIVSGLRYHHKMFRKGIIVDKQTYMAGSFGPKEEEQEFITPVEEAANGVMNRGHYQVKSCLKDDDKNVNLSWEWSLEINKDWIE